MIAFLDLHKINQRFEKVFHEKLQNVLDSGWYILGKEVQLFEEKFSNKKVAKRKKNGFI